MELYLGLKATAFIPRNTFSNALICALRAESSTLRQVISCCRYSSCITCAAEKVCTWMGSITVAVKEEASLMPSREQQHREYRSDESEAEQLVLDQLEVTVAVCPAPSLHFASSTLFQRWVFVCLCIDFWGKKVRRGICLVLIESLVSCCGSQTLASWPCGRNA